jgi:hypothetical protein
MSLMAQSLAKQATDSDWLAEDAAMFGRALVSLALETFNSMRENE